jgi:uncharacterized protein (DUF2252 family)
MVADTAPLIPHARQRLNPRERRELGKTRRKQLPRSLLAEYAAAADRPDPVALLETQARTRVADLVPIRYGRMLASPFSFYRGSALLMASDLAAGTHTGLQVQLCGDAHLSNFGMFASPERNLTFDVNDFDETLPGPWEWDVKRLLTSLTVAGRDNGFDAATCEYVTLAAAEGYRQRMLQLAQMGELELWYSHTYVNEALEASVDHSFGRQIRREAAKARSRGQLQALAQLTHVVGTRRRLVSDPPLLVPIEELVGAADAAAHERRMGTLISGYAQSLDAHCQTLMSRFSYVETARKVVGVGSVGTRAWVVLLLGRDDQDPLLLQVKEAQPSVLERFLPACEYQNAGQRVVSGQRLMQASSDILLGWLHGVGPDGHEGDYYVRQLRDWKGSADVESMSARVLADYGRSCGEVLARAHARTGDRIAIAAYLGRSDTADRALTRFAGAYAEQNQSDYEALRAAAATGRVTAEYGV